MSTDHRTKKALHSFLLSMADDELALGHRNSEWTGHSPILEEDIAFSNIAQDELGHSLVWYTELEKHTGKSPDAMAFERPWEEFTCCHFVTYPKGDFAYTVVRQFLFDVGEEVRLTSLLQSSYAPFVDIAGKLLREEEYHILHLRGLIERLGDATDESHKRMQAAVTMAFPQALGVFEKLSTEDDLIQEGVFPGNEKLQSQWLESITPVLQSASLSLPIQQKNGTITPHCKPDNGGRSRDHTPHLQQLIDDLQVVYRAVPGASW